MVQLTPERTEAFFRHLEHKAKEFNPEYPFDAKDDAFEYLWAITASLEGTRWANNDLHALLKSVRPDLYDQSIPVEELIERRKQAFLVIGIDHTKPRSEH